MIDAIFIAMCVTVLIREIGVRIVRLNWMVVLVVNDEMLGFLRQPNLRLLKNLLGHYFKIQFKAIFSRYDVMYYEFQR